MFVRIPIFIAFKATVQDKWKFVSFHFDRGGNDHKCSYVCIRTHSSRQPGMWCLAGRPCSSTVRARLDICRLCTGDTWIPRRTFPWGTCLRRENRHTIQRRIIKDSKKRKSANVINWIEIIGQALKSRAQGTYQRIHKANFARSPPPPPPPLAFAATSRCAFTRVQNGRGYLSATESHTVSERCCFVSPI